MISSQIVSWNHCQVKVSFLLRKKFFSAYLLQLNGLFMIRPLIYIVFIQVADAGLYLVEKTGDIDEGASWTNVTVSPPLPKIHKFKYTKPDLNTPFTVSIVMVVLLSQI